MAIGNLDGIPEFNYQRERKLNLPPTAGEPTVAPVEPEVTAEMTQELFRQLEGVIGKNNTLLAEIKRTTPTRIPVHPSAATVRTALRILYPGQSEDFISFDQYLESLDFVDKETNIDPIRLNSAMTGDGPVDSRLVSEAVLSQGTELSTEELLVMSGQIALLSIANKMMQTWQSSNTQQAVAGKMPPATEVASTATQLAVGIATILAQGIINKEDARSALKASFKDSVSSANIDSAVDDAAAQQPDPVMEGYLKTKNAENYEYIREYTQSHVTNTDDPGYEGWIAAEEAHTTRGNLQSSSNQADKYLTSAGAPIAMVPEMYKLIACKTNSANSRTDKLAAILSSKYTKDLLCCFTRFVGAIPTDQLKLMEVVLKIAANGISLDLGAAAAAVYDRANSLLEQRVLEPILHTVNQFFSRAATKILALIDPSEYSDPSIVDTIFICTPIEELFKYVLSALEKLRVMIVKYIHKYWRRIQLKNKMGSIKIQILADSKRCKVLLKLLRTALQSIENGNMCAQGDQRTPSPEDISDVLDEVERELPPSIAVVTDGDPYTTFSSEEMNSLISAEGIKVLQPISEKRPDGTSAVGTEDCARAIINDKTLKEFLARSDQLSMDVNDATI